MKKKYIIIVIILGIVLFFLFRIGFVFISPALETFTPQSVSIQLNPPKNSVVATIDGIMGAVKKEGRKDTQFNPLKQSSTLVEGEALVTENGLAAVHFSGVNLSLQKNTEIDYLNGLPNAVVVRQPEGSASYDVLQSLQPFSIRSLGLLIEVTGKGSFTVVTEQQTVSVAVKSGQVTVAYSDTNNTTQVMKISSGHRGIFDYTTSSLVIH